MFDRPLLLGHDRSEGAPAALQEAIEQAGALDAVLMIASAYRYPDDGDAELAAVAEAQATEAGVRVIGCPAGIDLADALVAIAEADDARMILIGADRPTDGDDHGVGATADELLRRSPVPVRVVHAAERA
jgi:nucleotide-binding universal stress UspA family protein